MQRGEVRWYKFQSPDKKRPVVILSRSFALRYLNEVTVAPVTSTIRDIPSEVLLSEADGMPKMCVANLDHIQTVAKHKLGSLIATLDHQKIKEINSACAFALGLDEEPPFML